MSGACGESTAAQVRAWVETGEMSGEMGGEMGGEMSGEMSGEAVCTVQAVGTVGAHPRLRANRTRVCGLWTCGLWRAEVSAVDVVVWSLLSVCSRCAV